jgi:hypothetical protein
MLSVFQSQISIYFIFLLRKLHTQNVEKIQIEMTKAGTTV